MAVITAFTVIRNRLFFSSFEFFILSGNRTGGGTKISGGSYLRESSSLFLNAATIITETSKQVSVLVQ
jgi:hypothetical protein